MGPCKLPSCYLPILRCLPNANHNLLCAGGMPGGGRKPPPPGCALTEQRHAQSPRIRPHVTQLAPSTVGALPGGTGTAFRSRSAQTQDEKMQAVRQHALRGPRTMGPRGLGRSVQLPGVARLHAPFRGGLVMVREVSPWRRVVPPQPSSRHTQHAHSVVYNAASHCMRKVAVPWRSVRGAFCTLRCKSGRLHAAKAAIHTAYD